PDPGSFFTGWSGACGGAARFCSVTLGADASATATFDAITANLAFATSVKMNGYFGLLQAGDALCAARAHAAGLSGTFVAFLSTSSTTASAPLLGPGTSTAARGWVRLDGKPLFGSVDDIVTAHRIYYPVLYDEDGRSLAVGDDLVWTGSTASGATSGFSCNEWYTIG